MTNTVQEDVVQPLREIRQPLYEGLSTISAAARAIQANEPEALEKLDDAVQFLGEVFLPACYGEDFTLLGAMNGVFGHAEATFVMMHQHQSMRRMANDLEKVVTLAHERATTEGLEEMLFPLLYGLYGAARVHLESEDSAYLELLNHQFTDSQVRIIVDNLRRIADDTAGIGTLVE